MRRRHFLFAASFSLNTSCLASKDAAGQSEQPKAKANANANAKVLPVPGRVFEAASREAFLIEPAKATDRKSKPWVWYAPTLKPYPGPEEKRMIERFLDAGISIAGIDVGESYGSPAGVAVFEKFHRFMVTNLGFDPRPALLARSRGGLMLYNWASKHPDQVSCIAGIYPVCDPSSWPGLDKAAPAYDMTADQLQTDLAKYNPVENLEPLAKSRVPILHIHGDADTVVPLVANSGEVARRYLALGGSMKLIVPPGQGHNMWKGFFECEELIDFVIAKVTDRKPN